MKLSEELERQTNLRHQLIDNGYRPLPLVDKIAFQKGWPTMPVDHAAVEGWPSTLKRGDISVPVITTGVQMTGDLIGVDVDVLDEYVVEDLWEIACDHFGRDWEDRVLIRVGKPPKELWLFRTDAPYAAWKTPRYVDEYEADHMIEVYGGEATRYFGCYGPHSLATDDETGKPLVENGRYVVIHEYEWLDGLGPAEVKPSQLPVVPVETLERFLTRANDILTGTGWERVKSSKGGHIESSTRYVLTREEVFDTAEGPMSYEDAAAYAVVTPGARCSASWLDGMPHKNRTRCSLTAVGDGDLQVYDFDSCTCYLPEDHDPRYREEKKREQIDRVGAALSKIDLGAGFESELEEASYDQEQMQLFEAALADIISRHARCRQTGHFHELRRGVLDAGVPYKVMVENYAHCELEYERPSKVSPNGPPVERRLNPMKVARETWVVNGGLIFDRTGFNPTTDERVYIEDGTECLNSWEGLPDLGEPEERDVDLMERFLEHLVPEEQERVFLMDWLATKYRMPWKRMCGVLFLAPGVSGTGRGALYELLHVLFGGYSGSATEYQLFGRFTDWLAGRVLITVNEVGSSTRYADKMADYQRIKELIDPGNLFTSIENKGKAAYKERTYHSIMIATNRSNGLHIDDEDRRLAVLRNGMTLNKVKGWADEFMRRFENDREALAAALAHLLETWEVTRPGRELTTPPRFKGWHMMVGRGDTEVDEAIQAVACQYEEPRAWTPGRLREEVRLELHGSRDARPKDGVASALANLDGERAERFGVFKTGRIRVGDRVMRSVFTTDPDWYLDLTPAQREEVLDKAPGQGEKCSWR